MLVNLMANQLAFFIPNPYINIPQEQLAAIIFQDSVQLVTQHNPLMYFTNYFEMPDANVEHPVLGNLNNFADAIEAQWTFDTDEPLSLNLVFNLIKFKLVQLGAIPGGFVPASSL